MVHVLQTTQNLAIARWTAKKCTKNYNARAQPLICSLNLLFSDVAVAVMAFLNSLLQGTMLHVELLVIIEALSLTRNRVDSF